MDSDGDLLDEYMDEFDEDFEDDTDDYDEEAMSVDDDELDDSLVEEYPFEADPQPQAVSSKSCLLNYYPIGSSGS